MAKTPNKIFDTARALLKLAITREDRLVRPPQLPTAAARQVVRSLLNNGFVEEIRAPIEDVAYTWRNNDAGAALMLRATDAGLAAAGAAPVPAAHVAGDILACQAECTRCSAARPVETTAPGFLPLPLRPVDFR